MHVVTKMLVVLSAVFCLLLSSMVVMFVSNADALRKENEKLQLEEQVTTVTLQNNLSATKDSLAEKEQEITELNDRINSIQQQQQEQAQSLSAAIRSKNEALSDKAEAQTTINQLTASNKLQMELLQSYRQEVIALRNDLLKSSERETDLVTQLNNLSGRNEVLLANLRRAQEDLASLQRSYAQGGDSGSTGGLEPNVLIRTRVVDVRTGDDGARYVIIDEGSNGGVVPGMKLNVVRQNRGAGSQFIGTIEIVDADAQTSAGRLDTLGKDVDAELNDIVVSRISQI